MSLTEGSLETYCEIRVRLESNILRIGKNVATTRLEMYGLLIRNESRTKTYCKSTVYLISLPFVIALYKTEV